MDIQGAEALTRRILAQQHWHWRHVRDGFAPAADPDAHRLSACEPGLRVYEADPVSGRAQVKRLDEGWWTEPVELPQPASS